ncbi:hypothetical protein [Streptomyces sp. NPDC003077]|uniref:hypothetical protein n=1 Tax=Streptomyces sp. NPDC003077 TaxID=3154443 RepID=UPI0033B6E873
MQTTTGRMGRMVVAAATAVMIVSGCGTENGNTVSTIPDRGPFDERAEQIARDWPQVTEVTRRLDHLLPLEGATRPKDPTARQVTVTVGHGACDARFGAHAREIGRFVVVAGWSVLKNPKGSCTDQLVLDKVTVHLKAALGDRLLVDAVSGERLPRG